MVVLYYSGLACLVLFDARGGDAASGGALLDSGWIVGGYAAMCAALLAMIYVPTIFHRWRDLTDALCADVLVMVTYALGAMIISRQQEAGCLASDRGAPTTASRPCATQHALFLHAVCCMVPWRFLPRVPSPTCATLVHSFLACALLAAYLLGPRITGLRSFVVAAVYPHLADPLARMVTGAFQVLTVVARESLLAVRE